MNLTEQVIAILLTAAVTLIGIPLTIAASRRFDLYDYPGRHKRHRRPVPFAGGTVLFIALWLTITRFLLFSSVVFGELVYSLQFIFAGSAIIYLVGLVDDLHPLRAWIKLLAEVLAGVVLYLGGLNIDPLSIPFLGKIALGPWSCLITVLWVVGLTNAINLIDGLDGLAAGVSLIAAATLALVGARFEVGAVMLFAYALIGFLPVFLYYNRHPARIFLGDSGSLQIGFYFAVISLVVPVKSFTAAALYVPLLALGVPLLETASSMFRRAAAGRNIMQADRRHLFHYLSFAGLTPGQVVLVFYGLSVIFGLFALAMVYWNRLVVFGFLVLFMVVIFLWFLIFTTNPARWKRRRPSSG